MLLRTREENWIRKLGHIYFSGTVTTNLAIRDIVFMVEKTIVDWEIENKSPNTESSRTNALPNREEVDSIEIESEPVDRFNTRQNREPAKEQREPAKQGSEYDSDTEVEEEPTMPNGGFYEDTPLERGEPPEDFRMKSVYC